MSDGKLPGKVDDDDVILYELKPEHKEIFTSKTEGILYNKKETVALIRISK
ncbi:MAG: hypothetical protein IH946_04895 [Bacteroidetes bacterium]|nr:hypothetical protein [Bacteroidota bacterium]